MPTTALHEPPYFAQETEPVSDGGKGYCTVPPVTDENDPYVANRPVPSATEGIHRADRLSKGAVSDRMLGPALSEKHRKSEVPMMLEQGHNHADKLPVAMPIPIIAHDKKTEKDKATVPASKRQSRASDILPATAEIHSKSIGNARKPGSSKSEKGGPGEKGHAAQFDIYTDKAQTHASKKDAVAIHAPADRMPSRVLQSKGLISGGSQEGRASSRADRLQSQVVGRSSRLSDGGGGSTSPCDEKKKRSGSRLSVGEPMQTGCDREQCEYVVDLEPEALQSQQPFALMSNVPRGSEAWGGEWNPVGAPVAPVVATAPVSVPQPQPLSAECDLDNFDMDEMELEGEKYRPQHPPLPQYAQGQGQAVREMGTMELMHDMLTKSFAAKQQPSDACLIRHHRAEGIDSLAAKVWVVRYVDYTSKYGLGFLLSNGSAGVYFNDSTKIVQSPDGALFNYMERKKKNGVEAPCATYVMTSYPTELQKKVTLLRHFRNYLLDPDSKRKNNPTEGGANFGHGNNDFGSGPMDLGGRVSEEQTGITLPFVKKWVRTRHAILFRLSDQTVQVVFFDQR